MNHKLILIFCLALVLPALGQEEDGVEAGPLFSEFPLTLTSGYRREAAGPLYYSQQTGPQWQWALPPLFACTRTPEVDWTEVEFLYPIMTYRWFGGEYRLQIVEFLSIAGGRSMSEIGTKRCTIFPFYFQQRSADTNLNYTALAPIYGDLKNRLFRDEIRFLLFPLYSKTRKKDVVTDNYLFPIFDVRRGDHLTGWQIWPLAGVEHKAPTLWTNSLDEAETVGGHDHYFAAWPFYFHNRDGLGTTNGETSTTVAPFYSQTRSAARDETSFGWPLGYNVIEDRKKKYEEHDLFWPLFVFAHGEKRVTRIFPFYSQAHYRGGGGSISGLFDMSLGDTTNTPPPAKSDLESDFYLWPVYKFNRLESAPLERRRTRILLFLYSDTTEKNAETGSRFHRTDFWPFYTYRQDREGNRRWQAFALLEPFFPNSRSITREYSQIWSVWRCEENRKTGAASQSLLWNLYRREESPQSKKCSLLFGVFQYQSGPEGRRWRVCHVTVGKKPARAPAPQS
jgi:hypothetical protein